MKCQGAIKFGLLPIIPRAWPLVTAFGGPVLTATLSVNSADPAVQINALQAQVTALSAQLLVSRLIADSVTQLKYNRLARKWNAAFPSQRVALKK